MKKPLCVRSGGSLPKLLEAPEPSLHINAQGQSRGNLGEGSRRNGAFLLYESFGGDGFDLKRVCCGSKFTSQISPRFGSLVVIYKLTVRPELRRALKLRAVSGLLLVPASSKLSASVGLITR